MDGFKLNLIGGIAKLYVLLKGGIHGDTLLNSERLPGNENLGNMI